MIDVGSEWRTFSNDKSSTDRSRVGGTEVSCNCKPSAFGYTVHIS